MRTSARKASDTIHRKIGRGVKTPWRSISTAMLCLGVFAAAPVSAQHPLPIREGIVYGTLHFTGKGKSGDYYIDPNTIYNETEDTEWVLTYKKPNQLHVEVKKWTHTKKTIKTGYVPGSRDEVRTDETRTLNKTLPIREVTGTLSILRVPNKNKGSTGTILALVMSGLPQIPVDTVIVSQDYLRGEKTGAKSTSGASLYWDFNLSPDNWGTAHWDSDFYGENCTGYIKDARNDNSAYVTKDKHIMWLSIDADWNLTR